MLSAFKKAASTNGRGHFSQWHAHTQATWAQWVCAAHCKEVVKRQHPSMGVLTLACGRNMGAVGCIGPHNPGLFIRLQLSPINGRPHLHAITSGMHTFQHLP
eukprot:276850-Pelagomonas_calceolata.AAC.5